MVQPSGIHLALAVHGLLGTTAEGRPVGGSESGEVKGGGGFLGGLLRQRLLAAGAEAVVPPVPARERGVTAQAAGGARIRAGLRGSFPSTSRLPSHRGPQGCLPSMGVEGPCLGPPMLSTTTAED
jgi:hypothetical protein